MYLNVTEIESGILALENQFPLLCERIELPNQTFEGRTISALRIGNKETIKATGVFFTANVHAREWGGADIAINFAADLLEAYTGIQGLQYGAKVFTATEVKSLVENIDVFVIPCVNPDGLNYTRTPNGGLWRKNRNTTNSNGDPNRIGVDLNRNQDFLWDFKKHFSPDADPSESSLASENPGSSIYHGPSPASEAETRNLVWLMDRYPIVEWYLDIHSYNGSVLHTWGNDDNQTVTPAMNFRNSSFDGKRGVKDKVYEEYIPAIDLANIQDAAIKTVSAINAVRGQSYQAKQSFALDIGTGKPYPTSGANDDYAYSRHWVDSSKPRVYGFTLEFGFNTFQPTWDEMEKIILDITAGMIEFCLVAQRGSVKPDFPVIGNDMLGEIFIGLADDGPGYVVVVSNGKIVKIEKVPSPQPWVTDILTGLSIYQSAQTIDRGISLELQKQALKMISDIAAQEQQRIS
jgi:murein tripeptide amidase MpaA